MIRLLLLEIYISQKDCKITEWGALVGLLFHGISLSLASPEAVSDHVTPDR